MPRENAVHTLRAAASAVGVIALLVIGNYMSFWFSATSPFAPRALRCNPDSNEPGLRTYTSLDEQTLPPEEVAWLAGRNEVVADVWRDYLSRAGLKGFDIDAFLNKKKLPTVALAFSGGGDRALLVGGGVIRAMDDRIPESVERGTGGILQLSSYISGLSGGSFLIGSLYTTDFQTIDYIHDHVWKLTVDTFTPTGGDYVADFGVYDEFLRDVAHKARAGYPTTLTDYWARLVSIHTTPDRNHGVNVTMSGLGSYNNFKSFKAPFPVVVWNERLPGQKDLNDYSNIWESSIYESGSWSPTIQGFIKTKHLGTWMENGKPVDNKCTVGLDHFGYVVGISSSVFNQALQDLDKSTNNKLLSPVIQFLTHKQVDAALVPNPFYKMDSVDNLTSTVKAVSLVDGGEDGQNVPVWPFLQPARNVDVLFATDSTVSYYEGGWPNGSSLISSAKYSAFSGVGFPPIPATPEEFLEQGLVSRTVFFGCERAPAGRQPYPLLVYVPNRYYSYPSNASTFRRVYSPEESRPFLMNGFDILSAAGAQDPVPADGQQGWSACLACALVSRAERDLRRLTPQCRSCMQDYCWSPTKIAGLDDDDDAIGSDADADADAADGAEAALAAARQLHPRVARIIEERRRNSPPRTGTPPPHAPLPADGDSAWSTSASAVAAFAAAASVAGVLLLVLFAGRRRAHAAAAAVAKPAASEGEAAPLLADA
ncbi:Lysophospholipase 1 [Cladochytrium tenue]|nr:Lysophospholipase 1 [Cladochytrium tenue]